MYPRIVVIFWHCRRPYMFSWSWRLPQLRRLSRCDSNARWGGRWGKCVRWRHFERERVNEWPTWPSSRGSWPTSLLSCRFRYVRTTNGQISGVPSAPVDTTQDVIPYCSNWLHSFILTLARGVFMRKSHRWPEYSTVFEISYIYRQQVYGTPMPSKLQQKDSCTCTQWRCFSPPVYPRTLLKRCLNPLTRAIWVQL